MKLRLLLPALLAALSLTLSLACNNAGATTSTTPTSTQPATSQATTTPATSAPPTIQPTTSLPGAPTSATPTTTLPTSTPPASTTSQPPASTTAPATTTATPPSTTSTVKPPLTGNIPVSISYTAFTPSELTIAAGTTVTLKASGHNSYLIQSSDPSEGKFTLADGETYPVRFYDKGVYTYTLVEIPDVKLVITVV